MDIPRLALVGCGSHASHNIHPSLAYARCSIDAVCDRERNLAERTAHLHGGASVWDDWRAMLDARRPDGVVVVGPPELHAAVAEVALGRGLPVFTEKLSGPDLATVERLVNIAEANGTFLMTGFMKRFGTPYRHIRSLIEAGRLVPAGGWMRYGHWENRDLRSMLHFMCVHPIDLAIALFGEPLSVDSRLAGTSRGALHLALTLRCSEDRLVQLTLDSAQPRIQERLEVSGLLDDGAALLCVDNVQYLEVHRQGRNGIDVVSFEEKMVRNLENWEIEPVFDLADIQVWRPDYAVPNVGQHRLFFQGYIGELREFANAIREHRSARPANRACLGAMRVAAAVLARPEGTTELIRNEQL